MIHMFTLIYTILVYIYLFEETLSDIIHCNYKQYTIHHNEILGRSLQACFSVSFIDLKDIFILKSSLTYEML